MTEATLRHRQRARLEHRPPGAPWRALEFPASPQAFVSFYLSDDLARWPVRAITLPKNNKSDPNLETLSYGLFSTCEPKMRVGIVNRNVHHIIFLTNIRSKGRHVTGYYELGWYTHGSLWPNVRDYALAARSAKFIEPISVGDFSGGLGDRLQRRWRSFILLDAEHSAELLSIVSGASDKTSEYLSEIDRLERINLYLTGYRYVSWQRNEPWTWEDAARYLTPTEFGDADAAPNTSPTGQWRCGSCGEIAINEALLKLCPRCHENGTLRPIQREDIKEGIS